MFIAFDAAQRAIDLDALQERVRFGWDEPGDGEQMVELTLGERTALVWLFEALDRQWVQA